MDTNSSTPGGAEGMDDAGPGPDGPPPLEDVSSGGLRADAPPPPDERRTTAVGTAEPRRSWLRRRRDVLIAAGAVVVAAAVLAVAVAFFITPTSFGRSTTTSASTDRDAAVAAARTVGATLTTIKGGDAAGTLSAWNSVITGPLADQFTKGESQLTQGIKQTPKSVSSTVANAALTEFDDKAGTAVALVFVDTTLSDPTAAAPSAKPTASAQPTPSAKPATTVPPAPSGQPAPSAQPAPSTSAAAGATPGAADKQRLALTISLTRTEQGWKASNLTQADPTKAGQ